MTIDAIKAKIPINWDLVGNPVNWIIVLLMIAIAGLSVSLIFHNSTGDV